MRRSSSRMPRPAALPSITHEPVTEPGDYIEFRSELDCLVAISNCPEDTLTPCNAYHCTPIKIEVFEQ